MNRDITTESRCIYCGGYKSADWSVTGGGDDACACNTDADTAGRSLSPRPQIALAIALVLAVIFSLAAAVYIGKA